MSEEHCSECGRWTQEGLRKLAEKARERPIYGTDFRKPLSQIIEDIRDQLVMMRGRLYDISSAYPSWKEKTDPVEGLLTCGLVALHYVAEKMRASESKQESDPFEDTQAGGR
jgi:hypothetical protein